MRVRIRPLDFLGPTVLCLALLASGGTPLYACIWDSDTLGHERRAHPKLAEAILNPDTKPPDPSPLRKRIQELQASRRENDPAWWNDLAGAHLRLSEAQEAVKLLEPLLMKFDTNYGIHANLGTAYHLLGRYKDAEREIARDLEINPEAHFGLEKYHLALLQYLIRDPQFQLRHVYVEEFTSSFLNDTIKAYPMPVPLTPPADAETNAVIRAHLEKELEALQTSGNSTNHDLRRVMWKLAELDEPPAYCQQWNLGADGKLEEGVIYMATLNAREPACSVMLGMKALHRRDLNLAIKAFERAIQLGSLQRKLLQTRIDTLQDHLRQARRQRPENFIAAVLVIVPVTLLAFVLLRNWAARRKARRSPA